MIRGLEEARHDREEARRHAAGSVAIVTAQHGTAEFKRRIEGQFRYDLKLGARARAYWRSSFATRSWLAHSYTKTARQLHCLLAQNTGFKSARKWSEPSRRCWRSVLTSNSDAPRVRHNVQCRESSLDGSEVGAALQLSLERSVASSVL